MAMSAPTVLYNGSTNWTPANGNVTCSTSTENPRISSSHGIININSTFANQGGVAATRPVYVPLDSTYMFFEIMPNRSTYVGELKMVVFGAPDSIEHDIPSLTAGVWQTVQIPIDIDELTETDSIGIYIAPLSSAIQLRVDYVRVATVSITGTNRIKFPARHTVMNNVQGCICEVVEFPFVSSRLASSPMPVDIELAPFADGGVEQGHLYVESSAWLDDLERQYSAVGIARMSEIPTGKRFVLEVVG
jgi:hypothetical protein